MELFQMFLGSFYWTSFQVPIPSKSIHFFLEREKGEKWGQHLDLSYDIWD